MSAHNLKCSIRGCNKKLDANGVPLEYCDFQQGRCPMQKKKFDWNNKYDKLLAVSLCAIIFITLFVVIYVGIHQ